MGYFGKIYLKFKAQNLRKKGFSYKEILREIPVSSDTISRWCKDISLTDNQKLRLINNKRFGQRKGSLVAAENKRNARIKRTLSIRKEAKKELGKLKERDKFITGVALYAAEGNKMDGKGGFTNTDPALIKFMTDWFTTFAEVPMNRLRGSIWLHEGLSEEKAKLFWSHITKIPLDQFRKTYIAKNKVDSKKVRKNIHQYGVFAVRFSNSDTHRKIMGWIYALFGDRIDYIPR